jgi:hypothetical protein
MANGLASTLNPSPFDPIGAVGGVMREPNLMERGRKAREATEPLMRGRVEAEAEQAKEEARLTKEQIDQEAMVQKGFVGGMERAQTELQQSFDGRPEPQISAFNPEKGIELAGLAAVMSIFGGAISGRAGLAALEGVVDGYRTGQESLYKREVETFNRELEKYKDKLKQADTIYNNALKLETERKGAGLIELKKLSPVLQSSFIDKKRDVEAFKGVDEALKEMKKSADLIEQKTIEAGLKPKPADIFGGVVSPEGARVRSGVNPTTRVPFLSASPYMGLDAKSQQTMFQDERKNYNKIQGDQAKQVEKANKTLVAMDRAEAALSRIETGGLYGLPVVGTPIQATMSAFDKDVSDFDSVSNEMQRQAYVPGEGQISNFERELFQRSNIGLGRPKETNEMIINAYRAAAQNTKDRAEFLDRFFRTNKTITGAEELWNIYLTANPILVENQNKNIVRNSNRKSYQEFFSDPTVTKRGVTYRLNFDTLLWEQQDGS